MLGLGDIVIPGILIALMLRLDDNVRNNVLRVYSVFLLAQIRQQKILPDNLFCVYSRPRR